jgi:spermidine synthase
MYAGKLLMLRDWKQRIHFGRIDLLAPFGSGMFLGIIAVSMWQQWSLTFGLDLQFLFAVAIVLATAFPFGARWQRTGTKATRHHAMASLLWCLAAWSLLHPYWIEALATSMSILPLAWLEHSVTKSGIALAVAMMGWFIPGILWSAACTLGATSSVRSSFAVVLLGVATGLLADSLVLAPWLGILIPTVVAACGAIGGGIWLRYATRNQHEPRPDEVSYFPEMLIRPDAFFSRFVRITLACLVGALFACSLRMTNQLMPHAAFVIYVQIAGAIAGMAGGIFLGLSRYCTPDRATWSGLFAAATSTLLLASQPWLVDVSLWMNSSLTTVTWLIAARATLLIVTTVPFGLALSGIAISKAADVRGNLIGWGAPFLIGLAGAMVALGSRIGTIPLMAGCGGLLLLGAGTMRVYSSGWNVSLRRAIAMGSLAAMALSLPLWRSCDDASRAAKLLFSTPAFIAYRSGWDLKHLPSLDDFRMIHRLEGTSGPLTLWRGRVAEVYIRESGVPRSVLTKNPEMLPQFAPEVLQAVYSLVLCDRPGRVLLLGLSAGVPLNTCLKFPIREAVCVEGDSNLIALVRGPLAREIGYDPLTDDRVTLQPISPELALMTRPTESFDVILSNPSASSMTAGATAFTQEFYQRASDRLAERGLFCQRFECVDYGPEPLQIVLKAIRQAFREVIAIETAGGELLLLAANSDNVFVPDELASRLEAPHVRRVLARSGMDWSTLLNQPAYDHAALGEICDDSPAPANSIFNGLLAARAPREVMRWGNKQQEVQALLTSTRLSKAPFWMSSADGQPNYLENEVQLSRRSRLVEWLGDSRVSQELLRRLNEVATQQKLVHENPDAHWWEYRKALRKQLQDRPRTAVQQVKAMDEAPSLHPEDIRRRDYFLALGEAARRPKPTREQISAVEEYVEPFDPLLSYFARQEAADMLGRSDLDAARELAYRLHVIYFSPTLDASVRNVATAIETLVKHPETVPDDSDRYDALNGLIQTLRTRWEIRQSISQTSPRKVLEDVDQSLIAIEKGILSLDEVSASAGVSDRDWQLRKEVIDRLLLRPLRSYRADVKSRQTRSQMQARAIIEEAGNPDGEEVK